MHKQAKKWITFFAMVLGLLLFSVGALAATAGNLTITLVDGGEPTAADFSYSGGVLTINSSAAMTISGTTSTDRILISSGITANLTFDDLSVQTNTATFAPVEVSDNGTLQLTLKNSNVLTAGSSSNTSALCLEGASAHLVITAQSTGTLSATSNGTGAGIGAGTDTPCGNITISGGTILATALREGAGIGAGSSAACGNITISGGNITATSIRYGAGIGGGVWSGSCGDITISGGSIIATARSSAGIGGGDIGGPVGNISISGGKITASSQSGAGIGGGVVGSPATNITISGGTITATGADESSGIGDGRKTDSGFDDRNALVGTLVITGGSVLRTPAANGTETPAYTASNKQTQVHLAKFTLQGAGNQADVTASSFAGYGLTDVCTDGSGNVYCWLPVTAAAPATMSTASALYRNPNVAIAAGSNAYVLSPVTTHTITATAGEGGSISPSDAVSVVEGSDKTFTITARDGYRLLDVLVDSVSVGAVNSYTFTNVTASHTIEAQFERIAHTITATAGEGGSISPSDAVSVVEGSDKTFTITARDGYRILDVLVDGVSVGAMNSYTFTNVAANHTIEAQFAARPNAAPVPKTGDGFPLAQLSALLGVLALGAMLLLKKPQQN